jgi:hypothetical protein
VDLYKRASDAAKAADEAKAGCKARLLTLIGDAEKVKGEHYSISAGVIGEAEIAYKRQAYRNFKINWRKTQ